MAKWMFWLPVVGGAIWVAVIGWIAVESWPVMSLDLAAGDPATRAAYDAAVTRHLLIHTVLAFGPPFAVLAILSIVSRMVRGRK